MVTLAARDYFFDSAAKRAYFSNFTNVLPLEREDADFASLEEACERLARGQVVLTFPEGTRSADGRLHAFKPGVGYLVLRAEVDVLPVFLDGTHRALPKGAWLPRAREVAAHIGTVVPFAQLRGVAADRKGVAAYRAIAGALHEAVRALRPAESEHDGDGLQRAFEGLAARFTADGLDRPLRFYFVLGDGDGSRWTVMAEPQGCRVYQGKHVAQADCVLKTSPAIFLRIVNEGYVPPVSAFAAGDVKTNAPELLREFQRLFAI